MARPVADGEPVLAQHVLQPLGPAGRAQEEDGGAASGLEVRGQAPQVAGVAAHGPARDVETARFEVHLAQVDGGRSAGAARQGATGDQRLLDGEGQRSSRRARAPRGRARGTPRPPRRRPRGRARPPTSPAGRPRGGRWRPAPAGRARPDPRAARPRSRLSRSAASSRRPAKRSGERAAQRGRARSAVAKTSESGRVSRLSRAPTVRWVSGIEGAEALHGVAQELEADGSVAVGGEDVEDAAAPRHLAGGRHRVLPHVAAFVERLQQDLRRHLVARPHAEHASLEQVRGEARAQQARRARPPPRAPPRARRAGRRPGAAKRPRGEAGRGRAAGPGPETAAPPRRARLRSERAQVLGSASTSVSRGATTSSGRSRAGAGTSRPRGTGPEARRRRAHPSRASSARLRARAAREGAARRRLGLTAAGSARRARVVERPGDERDAHDAPAGRLHLSRPTISSKAQSAPFTSTSGRRAWMTSAGVGWS